MLESVEEVEIVKLENSDINSIPRELKGKRLYGYSISTLGQILPFNFVGSLLMIYYVYTIGLNSVLVSIGTALGFLINAFASPIMGHFADIKQMDRFGKRRSLLLL